MILLVRLRNSLRRRLMRTNSSAFGRYLWVAKGPIIWAGEIPTLREGMIDSILLRMKFRPRLWYKYYVTTADARCTRRSVTPAVVEGMLV